MKNILENGLFFAGAAIGVTIAGIVEKIGVVTVVLGGVLLPIGLGVSVIAMREFLKRKFVTEMAANIDNLHIVMNKIAGLPANVAPQLALENIIKKLKIAEGISCAVAVLSILGGVVVGFLALSSEDEKTFNVARAGASTLLLGLGGLAIGAASLFSQMQTFLPTTYEAFTSVSHDAVSTKLFLEQFYQKNNVAMIGTIIAGSVCVAIGIVAALIINSCHTGKEG